MKEKADKEKSDKAAAEAKKKAYEETAKKVADASKAGNENAMAKVKQDLRNMWEVSDDGIFCENL